MPKITFLPADVTAEAPEGSMLLDAAKAAGIQCGNAVRRAGFV